MERMRRRPLAILAVSGLIVALAACGGGPTTDQTSPPNAAAPSTAAPTTPSATAEDAGQEFRVITDALGREVEVPATVDSVATHGTAARMVIYAGGIDKLTCVAERDQRAEVAMPYGNVYFDELADIPVCASGASAEAVYAEQVIMITPDILVSSSADPAMLDEMQEQTGVPVIGLLETIVQNNVFDAEIIRMIGLLGELFGTQERAETVTEAMMGWDADLRERTGDIPEAERRTAYTGAVSFNGAHGFDGTYAKYMPFDLVNVNNVVDETGLEGAFLVDLEKVAEWDPEYIFLNPQNMGLVNQGYAENPDYFNALTAVDEGRVYSQPAYIFSGTNFELAIANTYYVGKVVYPERFEDVEMDQITDEIFEVLLGVPYADTLNEAGLSFTELQLGQ